MIFSEDEAEFKGQSLSDLEVFLKTSMEGHAKALHKSDWVEAERLEEYTQKASEALREIPQRQFWANQARSYQAALREHHGGATQDPPGDAVAPAVAPAPSSAVAPAPSSSPPQRAETEAASASKRPRPCIAPMKFGFKKRPLRQASIGNRSRPRSREASAKKFASILQRWLGMLQEKLRVASAPTEMGARIQRRRFQPKPIKKPADLRALVEQAPPARRIKGQADRENPAAVEPERAEAATPQPWAYQLAQRMIKMATERPCVDSENDTAGLALLCGYREEAAKGLSLSLHKQQWSEAARKAMSAAPEMIDVCEANRDAGPFDRAVGEVVRDLLRRGLRASSGHLPATSASAVRWAFPSCTRKRTKLPRAPTPSAEKGGHLRRARTQLGLPPRRSPRRPQLPKKPPATPRRTPQEVEPVTVPIGVSLHGLSQSDVEAFKMLQLWPCKHQQAAELSTKDFPSWLPVSMHYIFKCADSKFVQSGTVQYLGHGRTRTTYALSDKLVLKVGRYCNTEVNLAQQTEFQLSNRLTNFFPATYACGNVELWENECHQWPKSVSFLVAERVQSMAAALMKTNSKRTIIRVMHFVVDMALQGVIPWDVRVSNLGVRGVQVVAIDSGDYAQTPAEKVEKSQLKSKQLMTPLFESLKEHARGEMELICSLEKCWRSCWSLASFAGEMQKLQEWDQEIEASDTTSTSKVEAADRTNELRSRRTKVKLLTPPAKLHRKGATVGIKCEKPEEEDNNNYIAGGSPQESESQVELCLGNPLRPRPSAAPASSVAASSERGAPAPGSPGSDARLVNITQAHGHKWTVVKNDGQNGPRKIIAYIPDGLQVEIVDEKEAWNSYKVRKCRGEDWDPPQITAGWVRRYNCFLA